MNETWNDRAQSIGRDKAIELANSAWWTRQPPEVVFYTQLMTCELCMPFGEFQRVAEIALNRGVFTHEFARPDNLMQEYHGLREAPSMDDIKAQLLGYVRDVIVVDVKG